ncbi:MAG: sel1 repeat family protein [Akkermansia sp.]|nr:sel1 repeat family protein [Akkermansia sp.]
MMKYTRLSVVLLALTAVVSVADTVATRPFAEQVGVSVPDCKVPDIEEFQMTELEPLLEQVRDMLVGIKEDQQKLKMPAMAKAAAEGNSGAQFVMGAMHLLGYAGLEKDYNVALRWLTASAEKGYADACVAMGCFYSSGVFSRWWTRKGINWLTAAAEGGHAVAQYQLSVAYLTGAAGVEQDLATAEKWYKKAVAQNDEKLKLMFDRLRSIMMEEAKQGEAETQCTLATMYYLGLYGFEENEVEAVKWFTRAAEKGLLDAQVSLAEIYEAGVNGKPDLDKAIHWYTKAATQGDADAEDALKRLEK